jgi:hypothetical protein
MPQAPTGTGEALSSFPASHNSTRIGLFLLLRDVAFTFYAYIIINHFSPLIFKHHVHYFLQFIHRNNTLKMLYAGSYNAIASNSDFRLVKSDTFWLCRIIIIIARCGLPASC